MAMKKLEGEGWFACKIVGCKKTRDTHKILMTLKTKKGQTKVVFDLLNSIQDCGVFSSVLKVVGFQGIISKPEEVLNHEFEVYLKTKDEFAEIVMLREVKTC